MRIKVDAEKCEGHSRCYSLAPELVDVDDLRFRPGWRTRPD